MTTPITRRALQFVTVFAVLATASCGSDAASSDATVDATSDTSVTSETAGTTDADAVDTTTSGTVASGTVPAAGAGTGLDAAVDTTAGVTAAQWSSNVEITLGDDTFTFKSDGLPRHELPDQFLIPEGAPGAANPTFVATDTSSLLSAADIEVEIPLNPVYSETITDNPLGQIGVIISGAQLFNDFENMERTIVAIEDQTVIDGVSFLDSCNGHPLASGADYHYHGIPYCISDTVDVAGEHSAVLGFMLDGFPVYANKGADGVALTNADLDECSGHFEATPEFPEGIYHYHLTDDAAPYSINCYHGVVDASVTAGGGAGGAGGAGAPAGQGPPAGQAPPDGQGPPPDGQGPPPDGQGPPPSQG